MMLLLTLLLASPGDPRPELIELQLAGRQEVALERVEQLLESEPETGRALALEYLRGHLLEHLGKASRAPEAFAAAMTSAPMLSGYSRYRLAAGQHRDGHPEVAAGLLASLLAHRPPRPLVPVAVRLLTESLARGGDCRLLERVDEWPLPAVERRPLKLSQADCDLSSGDSRRAGERLFALLAETRRDETARGAAERLARLDASSPSATSSVLLGLTFYHHREFGRALLYLERALAAREDPTTRLPGVERSEVEYAVARSLFWQREYAVAAARFRQVADSSGDPEERARALYQRARSLELQGDWSQAVEAYRLAYTADRSGEWAPYGLISALRIEWRRGREQPALELLDELRSRASWRPTAERAVLFLAVSDIVRGRYEWAEKWLRGLHRSRGRDSTELHYWQGRVAQLQDRLESAVTSYVAASVENPFHPLALGARSRLQRPPLAELATSTAARLANSSRLRDLLTAWHLLGDADARGRQAREHLQRRLRASPRHRPYLDMQAVPVADWSLWQQPMRTAEELLLGLGVIEQVSTAISRHFPPSEVSLALTGSRLLASAGLHRPSLQAAQVLAKGLPTDLPPDLLPSGFQRLLYPRPYDELVQREASRFGIDADLLRAIIREESSFDTEALSAASARGLTQFVLPTARRLADKLGWPDFQPADLYRPELSITLGAAYLAELAKRFEDRPHVVIAAYNAGEDQAGLWLSLCFSREAEEFFSKVGFSETRAYVSRVVTSRGRYREIYASPGSEPD